MASWIFAKRLFSLVARLVDVNCCGEVSTVFAGLGFGFGNSFRSPTAQRLLVISYKVFLSSYPMRCYQNIEMIVDRATKTGSSTILLGIYMDSTL